MTYLLPSKKVVPLSLLHTGLITVLESQISISIPGYLRKYLHPHLGAVTGRSSGHTETPMHGTACAAVTRRPETGCCSETSGPDAFRKRLQICMSYQVFPRGLQRRGTACAAVNILLKAAYCSETNALKIRDLRGLCTGRLRHVGPG